MPEIATQPLLQELFDPFGDVIEMSGHASFQINRGMCDRYHDLAKLEFTGDGARANISLARSQASTLPLRLDMMERHPDGSQAFIPMTGRPFLVVVAPDDGGVPGVPLAFLTRPGQGINYHRNVWHGVLTPLGEAADFVIVDRVGPGDNLQEHRFDSPYLIVRAPEAH